MKTEMQNFLRAIESFAQSIDSDVALLVLGLTVIYLFLLVTALRERGFRREAETDREKLVATVDDLSRQVAELREELRRQQKLPPPMRPSEIVSPEVAPVEIPPQLAEVPAVEVLPVEVQPVVEVAPRVEAPPAQPVSPMVQGMSKSRSSLLGKIKSLFTGRTKVDLSSLDNLEEMLITSDVGARVADSLVTSVRELAAHNADITETTLRTLLRDEVRKELIPVSRDHRLYTPTTAPLIVLVVGVNGVGKTTTVAKLATRYQTQGKKVLAIAADTFRAAAVQQLKEWGTRSGFEVFSGAEGAKPAAVVFDGMVAALERQVDVVLIDTGGRLHTKSNLMQELEGVRNSIRRHVADAPHETVLVLDGVSGQNALSQAREFNASTPLTGIVVTKLDGTPKGGIIVAISQELKVPVLYVGVGEKAQDLIPFSIDEFVDGLLSDDGEELGDRGNSLIAANTAEAGNIV